MERRATFGLYLPPLQAALRWQSLPCGEARQRFRVQAYLGSCQTPPPPAAADVHECVNCGFDVGTSIRAVAVRRCREDKLRAAMPNSVLVHKQSTSPQAVERYSVSYE